METAIKEKFKNLCERAIGVIKGISVDILITEDAILVVCK